MRNLENKSINHFHFILKKIVLPAKFWYYICNHEVLNKRFMAVPYPIHITNEMRIKWFESDYQQQFHTDKHRNNYQYKH